MQNFITLGQCLLGEKFVVVGGGGWCKPISVFSFSSSWTIAFTILLNFVLKMDWLNCSYVWHAMICHGMPQHAMTCHDVTWHEIWQDIWHYMTWHVMTSHNVTWHDITWYDMGGGPLTWHHMTWHKWLLHVIKWYCITSYELTCRHFCSAWSKSSPVPDFGPKQNTKFGLHTTTHHHHPPPPTQTFWQFQAPERNGFKYITILKAKKQFKEEKLKPLPPPTFFLKRF